MTEAQHIYQTRVEFLAPLAPAFHAVLRPKSANYRGRSDTRPIRTCSCGKAYLRVDGRPVPRCAVCQPEYVFKATPAMSRRWKLRTKFGLSEADYAAMMAAQAGVCAICHQADRTGRRLAVDHDHNSGRVRGLLCTMCNTAIGKLGDSAVRLRRAAAYLEAEHVRII